MAIDSAQKRFSMMNLSMPWQNPVTFTDTVSGVDQAERQSFLFQYSGIAWGAVAAVVDERTMTGFVALSVSSGDKFRVRVQRTDGTDNLQTSAQGSGLMALLLRQIP